MPPPAPLLGALDFALQARQPRGPAIRPVAAFFQAPQTPHEAPLVDEHALLDAGFEAGHDAEQHTGRRARA